MSETSGRNTCCSLHRRTHCCSFMVRHSPRRQLLIFRSKECRGWTTSPSVVWDVYLVDVRGYGRSTRPPEMDQPADSNAPIVTTDVAVKDVGSAIDFILQRRGISRINLMGWSWGTE